MRNHYGSYSFKHDDFSNVEFNIYINKIERVMYYPNKIIEILKL